MNYSIIFVNFTIKQFILHAVSEPPMDFFFLSQFSQISIVKKIFLAAVFRYFELVYIRLQLLKIPCGFVTIQLSYVRKEKGDFSTKDHVITL